MARGQSLPRRERQAGLTIATAHEVGGDVNDDDVNNNNSQVVQFVDASQLAAARLANQQVVSVRIELLLKSEPTNIQNTATNQVRLLSEAPLTLDVKHYYQVFAVSVALRNSLNYVGSAAL